MTGTRDGVGDRAGELEVEAVAGAVAVHRREQDLAGAEPLGLRRPRQRVEAGRRAAAVGEDLEARRRRAGAARVDGDDHALGAELRRRSRRSSSGRATAAVLSDTLSAPARSRRRASSTERMPPPMVNGMNTCSAVAGRHVDDRVAGVGADAVMSRKTSSSAPSAS